LCKVAAVVSGGARASRAVFGALAFFCPVLSTNLRYHGSPFAMKTGASKAVPDRIHRLGEPDPLWAGRVALRELWTVPSVDQVMAQERAAAFTKRSIKTSAKLQGLKLAVSIMDVTQNFGRGNHVVTLVMLEAIRDYFYETGIRIGMKPAGGIRMAKQALAYLSW
jgi:hypothetical protein